MAEGHEEIEQARSETAELCQLERDPAEELRTERARVAALQSRGFIARLLNRSAKLSV